jgi:pimeloyl-ACP methyl ester carboxylesterase
VPFADLPGDVRLHYDDDDFTDPWLKSETVILQHGQAKSARLWYAWVPLLARDYRVIRIDSRGFGESPPPPENYEYAMDDLADDIVHLMDGLQIDRAHVIGDTVGGAIALTCAYRHAHRVFTVACCQSTFKLRGVSYYMGYHDFVRDHGVEAWVRSQHPEHDAREEWVIHEMSKTPARAIMGSLVGFSSVDLTDILPRIKTPVVVIQGDADEMRLNRAREMASLLPNGHLAALPGVHRATQVSPELSVAAWRAFVEANHPA